MTLRSVVRCLTFVALTALPALAAAHIKMATPVPRSDDDAVKDGPCGAANAKGAPQVEYTEGQQVMVHFAETIDHTGCFQITLSSDDATFQLLAQTNDPHDVDVTDRAVGAPRTIVGTLPPGITCENCTLQIRQIMLENETATFPGAQCHVDQDITAAPLVANKRVYFACADVRIVAAPVPDAGVPSSSGAVDAGQHVADAAAPSGSKASAAAQPDDPETSSGRIPVARDQGGCSAAPASGVPAFGLGALGALSALALRRHQRSGNKLR